MTRQDIINLAASNPDVIKANTRWVDGKPVTPDGAQLESLADRWIDVVIEEMLSHEAIRRGVSQHSYSLTLVSGTTTYTLPDNIGRVLDITEPTYGMPLSNFVTIRDFLRWNYENNNPATTLNDTIGYYFPERDPTTNALKVTFVYGVSGGGTATIWFLAKSDGPYDVNIFPANLHHVVMNGVLGHLAGGQYMGIYEEAMDRAGQQLIPKIGGISRARMDPRWRNKNWRRSNMAGVGGSSYVWPPHRTN